MPHLEARSFFNINNWNTAAQNNRFQQTYAAKSLVTQNAGSSRQIGYKRLCQLNLAGVRRAGFGGENKLPLSNYPGNSQDFNMGFDFSDFRSPCKISRGRYP